MKLQEKATGFISDDMKSDYCKTNLLCKPNMNAMQIPDECDAIA